MEREGSGLAEKGIQMILVDATLSPCSVKSEGGTVVLCLN